MRRHSRTVSALRLAFLAALSASLLGSCFVAGGGPNPWTGGSVAKGAAQDPAASDGRGAPPARPAIAAKAGTALLIRGSARERGLPFLGQNALETLTGSYILAGDDGAPAEIDLWHCAEPLIIPAAWSPRSCPGLPAGFVLRAAPPAAALAGIPLGRALWVLEAASYRIFMSLPAEFGGACRFAAALGERFEWFRRYAAAPSDLSFPALLEYGP